MKKIYPLLSLLFLLATFGTTSAQTIWTGTPITFTKADFADWTMAANQDRLTSNVWITRADKKGIFNIKTETEYSDFASPADTEWAFGTTANIATLTFSDWETTISSLPPQMVNQDMVLHLITDDIYIDIKFTSWTAGNGSGVPAGSGFSYTRSSNQSIELMELDNVSTPNIYPNPATDFIQVTGLFAAENFSIYNVLGSIVTTGSVANNETINIESLKSGVYFIKFEDGKSLRFVKE